MILLAAALAVQGLSEGTRCPEGTAPAAVTCQALSHQEQGEHALAAAKFEQLADMLPKDDPKRDRALAAAGNMWIAADEPAKAAAALDLALAGTFLQAEQRGEALLDRARAAEAQNDLDTARARVNAASAIIGDQPFLWYFSAALAIREGDPAMAKSAIDRALALSPDDPLLLFEAGHVAHFSGNAAAARAYWARAAELDPSGEAGKSARDALGLLDPDAAVQSQPEAGR